MVEPVSDLAAVATAIIALVAAATWRRAHKHQRADECVAAIYDIRNLVDRIKWADTQTIRPDLTGPAFFDAWNGWRRFQLAHIVASRYYRLDHATPARVATLLGALEVWSSQKTRSAPAPAPDSPYPVLPIEEIERRLDHEAATITALLRGRWDDILLAPKHWPRP